MRLQQENTRNGKVNDDSYHLGNLLMDFFNNGSDDHAWQIDAGTGEVDMKSSVKSRSIQLARCLRNAGLKPGDAIVVSGVNHIHVNIPFYAAYLNGLPVVGIDSSYKYEEIKVLVELSKPKLAFCEAANMHDYENVFRDLGLDTTIVTFGDSDRSYTKFVEMYDDNAPENEFKVATFDTNKVYAWLVSTSGTTGLPKLSAFRHTEILMVVKVYSTIMKKEKMAPVLALSSVQWISGYIATLIMIYGNQIKVQTSSPLSVEHAIDIINKYKPGVCTATPSLFNDILKHDKYCDLTCFDKIVLSGIDMNVANHLKLKARMRPDAVVWNAFGQTECIGATLMPAPDGPIGNIGIEWPMVKIQLVDPTTGEVVTKPNTPGELWCKGPRLTEYYNAPEDTAAAFSPDGWFKSGDLVYRDENGYYFFVERKTSTITYRNSYVLPLEVELMIRKHPDVDDVCVVGIPHPEDVMRTVACVQLCPGSTVTEKQIKDLVAEKLSWNKHLHGGVIFVDNFPRTFSGKIARAKVRDFILEVRNTQTSEYPCSGNTKRLIRSFQQLSSNNTRYTSTGTH